MITITSLSLSPDNKYATIKVSILPEQAENRVMAALKHAAPFIRRETSDKVALATLPAFNFELDRSLKNQAAVLEALRAAGVMATEGEVKDEPGAGDADAKQAGGADDKRAGGAGKPADSAGDEPPSRAGRR